MPAAPASNTSKYIDTRVHCPFGCVRTEHDEHGYCCHLAGFTNKGKVMERLEYLPRTARKEGEPEPIVTPVVGRSREPVQAKDRIVNPERQVRTDAGLMEAQEWVSSRVYRKCSDEEKTAWVAAHVRPADAETDEVMEDEI